MKRIEEKIIDNIRSLSIDMITEAKSGHPGIALGAAPIMYTLFANHINIDPENPNYFNRDRFILSAGHGSALLYSTLYFAGYGIELDDLKKFRKINSITPGHPELGVTPGVDMTTGPLGEGVSAAVGVAMAERYLNATFNDAKKDLINFYTYVLCGEGDLMEGASYEAMSLAGLHGLNKLIVLFDHNNVTLDADASKTFNENITFRFNAINWNVITVEDGESVEAISKAIEEAKSQTEKPTIIEIKTTIGKYSNLEGTNKVHGGALSKEDVTQIKKKLGIRDIPFTVSKTCLTEFRKMIESRCKNLNDKFLKEIDKLDERHTTMYNYLVSDVKSLRERELEYEMPENNEEAGRVTGGKILTSIVNSTDFVIGGAADLSGPCKVYIDGAGDFSKDNYMGKNIFYGVREHGMAAISNGLALMGLRPFAATFLSFSDFMKPSIRLACMMKLPITYIFTHDSISVGEDGATHQPVEQLVSLRSTPNLDVFRPADVNEIIGTYKTIYDKKDSPAAVILSRNSQPILSCTKANEVYLGGYIAKDFQSRRNGIIISCGEELSLAIKVANKLQARGIDIRVVSMPNINRFLSQDKEYIDKVLPVEVKKIVIEASSSYSWNSIVFNPKYLITVDTYGKSGTKEDIYKEYGFDLESLEKKVEELLK